MLTQGINDLPFLGGSSLRRQLTSYWKMDEHSGARVDSRGTQNLTDVSSNVGFNTGSGILSNTNATFIPYDGTKALQASSTPYLGNASFTISGWIRWAATTGGIEIAKWGSVTTEYLLYDPAGNTPLKWQASEAGTLTLRTLDVVTTGLSGVFAYYTLGYDDINKQLFAYVNAVSQGTSACNGINVSTNNFTIGNLSTNGTSCQSGFQDIGFWRRVLTPAEVTRLYNGGAGLSFNRF